MVFQRKRAVIIALLVVLLALSKGTTAFSHQNKKVEQDFARLKLLLEERKISSKGYMDSIEKFSKGYLAQGIFIESGLFRHQLNTFRKLCFEDNNDTLFQTKYYEILANNSIKNHRYGEEYYYINKIIKLNGKNEDKKLRIITWNINYHGRNKNSQKTNREYLKNKIYIDNKVDQLLKNTQLNGIPIFTILNFAAYSSAELNDTSTFTTIEGQSRKLKEKFLQLNGLTDTEIARIIFLSETIPVYKAKIIEKNYKKTFELADAIEAKIKEKIPIDNTLAIIIKDNFTNLRASVFLSMKEADSAEKHLGLLNKKSYIDGSQTIFNDYILLSNLYETKNNYKKANKYKNIAIDYAEKKITELQNEMEELIYSFSEAEESKAKQFRAEKVSQKRAMWILIISFVAILIVLWFITHIRKRNSEVKKRINLLNYQASIQIAELEESKNVLQEDLGRDLHDNLASLLAGIKNKIEYLNIENENNKAKNILEDINLKLEDAYLRVRNKSHDLYREGYENSEQNFEKRIKQLIDFTLPEQHIEKEILIDNGAINLLNTNAKIELLKIIQELITNIIKHAKASKISLVIYEDENNFYLSIKDNGKGFDTHKKPGLGINSIKSRVQKMGGKTNILSNNSGTEINIILPGNNL